MQDGAIPRRISKAYQSALATLTAMAGELGDAGRTRFPPLTDLAGRCGVAKETVRRALRTLQARGVVTIVPGGGVFVRDTAGTGDVLSGEAEPVLQEGRRWQQLRERFSDDIFAGVYGPGEPLPSYKELSRRYGTSHATLRKALHSLVADRRGSLSFSDRIPSASGLPVFAKLAEAREPL